MESAEQVRLMLLHHKLTAQTTLVLCKKRLKEIEQALDQPGCLTYLVIIESAWSDEGEKDVEYQASTVELAIEGAKQEFMRVNHRSDVQGAGTVYIRLPSGDKLSLCNMRQFSIENKG